MVAFLPGPTVFCTYGGRVVRLAAWLWWGNGSVGVLGRAERLTWVGVVFVCKGFL
jgi:hypothetical protein